MIIKRFGYRVGIFCFVVGIYSQMLWANTDAVGAYEIFKTHANTLYKNENYRQAFFEYKKMAKVNNKYAQNLIGTMLQEGQGVNRNIPEAYAWLRLASEDKHIGYVRDYKSLLTRITERQLEAGLEIYDKYRRKYGNYGFAQGVLRLVQREKRNCTGSKTGATCSSVRSSSSSCSIRTNSNLSQYCLTLGAAGIRSITGIPPVYLKKIVTKLEDDVIRFNPGKVELRELQVKPDESR